MQTLICVALLAICPILIIGQSNVKSDSTTLKEISDLFTNSNYSKAVEKANLATEDFIKKGNWERLLECQNILFRVEFSDTGQKSLISNLEHIHSFIPDSLVSQKAISSFNIALIEDIRGNIINALKYYNACIEPFKELEDSNNLAGVLENIGILYTQYGDYARANKYYKASAELRLQANDIYGYSYNVFNLALNAFYKKDFQESETLFRQYQTLEPNYKEETYLPLAELKVAQLELDSARIYLNKAKTWNDKNDISTLDIDFLNAEILCIEGNVSDAIQYISKYELEIDSIRNSRERGIANYTLADMYAKNEDFDKALYYYDKSMQSFSNGQVNIDSIDMLRQRNYLFHEIWFGDILIGLSNVYAIKYRLSTNETFKDKSKNCLDLALESLDYKRSVFEDIESSFSLNEQSKYLYEKAINNYLDWYEESELESEVDMAFQLAQRHNAFILRQQINTRTKLDRHQVDELLREEYLDLKLKAIEASLVVGKEYSNEGFEKLIQIESKLDSMEQILSAEYIALEASKNDFSVASVSDIQEILSEDQAIIKYFEGENALYSFVISQKEIRFFIHQNVDTIRSDIDQVRTILSDYKYERSKLDSIERYFLDAALRLGKSILSEEIASLPQLIKRLTIIPSGALTKIPFETLAIREKDSWKDPTQYLIKDYAISYNYFCKALTSPKISKVLENVLSYGLKYDEYTLNASKKMSNDSLSDQIIEKFRSEEMGHLYFADDEANEVAEMFEGVSFLNENATKQSFLSNVIDYDIIHLSAHSFVDYQYPSNSAIIFSKKDSLTDNLLQIKDVDRLSFDGQLFTLSACNTFFGKKNEGEGLSSMARSFIQSGAGSVVGSFWSVPDEISKSFMVRFYSKLKAGMEKDEALRATKIDFMTDDNLSSPLYRSPVYWSAWVIYGDTQSISASNTGLIYFGIGLFFFCMLLFIKYR